MTVLCPTHDTPLYGGPTVYGCPTGDHEVHAADINHEYHAPKAVA